MDKTGGTTVKWMLRSSFGLHHCDVESWYSRDTLVSARDLRHLRRFYPRLESIAGHQIVPYSDLAEACPDIQYFTFLRDPLKRCASFFQYIAQTADGHHVFEEWIQKEIVHNAQVQKIAGTDDVHAAIQVIQAKDIFVGLTEFFDESLLLLKSLVADDLNISYKSMKVARDNTLAESLLASEHTHRMLRDANRADLELYACVKRELYPSYQREYGHRLRQDVVDYQHKRERFNSRNVLLNRMHRNLVYKPALKLYRLGQRAT